MKKTILTIILSTLSVSILVTPALAATTVSFSPASVKVAPGQGFNVAITVNPQGVSNYVEKVVLNYPADTLEVKSFSLGNTWMAMTQSGYDLVDNANGVLVKTAGYPSGISSSVVFGTVSFYAKKAGSGTITIGNNSLAFEVNSQSALSGSPMSFIITAPAVTTPKPTIPTQVVPSQPTTPVQPTEQPVSRPIAKMPQTSFMASIVGALTLGTGNVWLGILVGLIILAIVAYVIYTLIQRKRKNLGKIK